MDAEHASPDFKIYWLAWGALLILTLLMVFFVEPAVLIAGMLVKGGIIALWFMDLRHELWGFTVGVTLMILGTGALLFFLIIPDGLAM